MFYRYSERSEISKKQILQSSTQRLTATETNLCSSHPLKTVGESYFRNVSSEARHLKNNSRRPVSSAHRSAHRGSLRQKRTSTAASAPKPHPPTDRSAARKPQVKHYESQQSRYAPATNPLNLASKHLPYPHPVQQWAHPTTKDAQDTKQYGPSINGGSVQLRAYSPLRQSSYLARLFCGCVLLIAPP